jgi:hypothetical protein
LPSSAGAFVAIGAGGLGVEERLEALLDLSLREGMVGLLEKSGGVLNRDQPDVFLPGVSCP